MSRSGRRAKARRSTTTSTSASSSFASTTAKKRVPVIAGTGSNSTDEAIELSEYAEKIGADAVLIVTPYYNKPTQEGLYQHFKAINDAIGIPIIIYNIPGRSVVDMSVQTMARCYELKNIAGVKDATANLARPSQTRAALGPDFCQLSGEDATALGFMAHGGAGCISVASNVAPRLCAEFQNACLAGDFKKALALQDRLMPLHEVLFIETIPGPAKYAVSRLGFGTAEMRLPMVPISEARAKPSITCCVSSISSAPKLPSDYRRRPLSHGRQTRRRQHAGRRKSQGTARVLHTDSWEAGIELSARR